MNFSSIRIIFDRVYGQPFHQASVITHAWHHIYEKDSTIAIFPPYTMDKVRNTLSSLKSVTFCSLNIHGLFRRIEELSKLLNKNQKTFLNNSVPTESLEIPKYHIYI